MSVDLDHTALFTITIPKQESVSGEIAEVKAENATMSEIEDMDTIPPQTSEDSATLACSLLGLPVKTRIRIYNHLFADKPLAIFGPDAVRQFKVHYSKRSGIALCFTCRQIAEESRSTLYSHLKWAVKKDVCYISLLSNPFHDAKLIRNISIPARGSVQLLKSLAQHQLDFTSLLEITVNTAGRVFTSEAPNRQSWSQLSMSLRDKWNGLPSEVWAAARLLNRNGLNVVAVVNCMYYPYMKGKRRDWHDKQGSWCSEWRINLNSGTRVRTDDKWTRTVSGPWPRTGYRLRKQGAETIKVFNESQIIKRYAGEEGNPFKKP